MDGKWLKNQFDKNPIKTKAKLAHVLGLEPPAISKILGDKRQIKASEYTLMRKFFGLPVDGENAVNVPANSYVLEPLRSENAMQDDYATDEEWVMPANIMSQRTKAPSDKIKVFQVQENIMEPDFKVGEHVVVDLSDTTPSPPGTFIISDGFGHLIRHCEFVPRSSPPKTKISAIHDGFEPHVLNITDFEIIGRVIAKLQWL